MQNKKGLSYIHNIFNITWVSNKLLCVSNDLIIVQMANGVELYEFIRTIKIYTHLCTNAS